MRILIHSNRQELDRNLEPVNYDELPSLKKKWGGNLGNKLFLTSMDVYCHADGIEYEYLTEDMTADYINNVFDLILWPLANCFAASKEIMSYLKQYTLKLSEYKIPVLALGAGAQAASYDDLNELIAFIKPTATNFIDAVHRTGGIFGLRGFFTKELFHRLGYSEDYVIGCPSMYQMGRNLFIDKKTLNNGCRVALNGDVSSLRIYRKNDIYKEFPNSWFIDQGEFVIALYEKRKEKTGYYTIRKMMDQYSRLGVEMLAEGKIVCIYDLPRLANYLKELNIDLSFGQRIHGNILCTLLKIPSIVYVHDSRTRELAEFFEIPTYSGSSGKINLYEAFSNASWSGFNKNFTKKYDQFEKLLITYGMPPISTNKYHFLTNLDNYPMPEYVNDYSLIKRYLSRKYFWIGKK